MIPVENKDLIHNLLPRHLVQIRVARFFLTQKSKWGKLASKLSNWSQTIPNGHRINQPYRFQGHPKFTQIRSFGLKIYQLATIVQV
jgi:hypothetical protein